MAELIRRTRDGGEGPAQEIVAIFEPGIRFFLGAAFGPGVIENVGRAVTEAIRCGAITEPEQLPRFILGIIGPLRRDRQTAPDSDRQAMRGLLSSLPARDREIVVRAYTIGQPPEEIAAGMGLTEGEVRQVKSRARAAFERLTQGKSRARRVARKPTATRFSQNFVCCGARGLRNSRP